MLSPQTEEKRRRDRISKRQSRERQRRQKQVEQNRDVFGLLTPVLSPESPWSTSGGGISDEPHLITGNSTLETRYQQPDKNPHLHAHDGAYVASARNHPIAYSFLSLDAPLEHVTWTNDESTQGSGFRVSSTSPDIAFPSFSDAALSPPYQQSLLHRAITTGNMEIIRLLLYNGAGVNSRNHEGRTPLQLAVLRRSTELVRLLLQHNADIEARDAFGQRAVDLAVDAQDSSIVEILLAHGTSV